MRQQPKYIPLLWANGSVGLLSYGSGDDDAKLWLAKWEGFEEESNPNPNPTPTPNPNPDPNPDPGL